MLRMLSELHHCKHFLTFNRACTAIDAMAAKLSNGFTLIVPPITDVGYFARQVQDSQVLSRLVSFGITCEGRSSIYLSTHY